MIYLPIYLRIARSIYLFTYMACWDMRSIDQMWLCSRWRGSLCPSNRLRRLGDARCARKRNEGAHAATLFSVHAAAVEVSPRPPNISPFPTHSVCDCRCPFLLGALRHWYGREETRPRTGAGDHAGRWFAHRRCAPCTPGWRRRRQWRRRLWGRAGLRCWRL